MFLRVVFFSDGSSHFTEVFDNCVRDGEESQPKTTNTSSADSA